MKTPLMYKEKDAFILMALTFILGIVLTFLACMIFMAAPLKKQAVERGFAEWQVTDTSIGATKFVWKENQNSNLVRFSF
jgi:hypothetical protein